MIVSPTTTLSPVVLGLLVLEMTLVKVALLVATVAPSVMLEALPPTGVVPLTKPGPPLAPDQFRIEPAKASVVPTAWVSVSFRS